MPASAVRGKVEETAVVRVHRLALVAGDAGLAVVDRDEERTSVPRDDQRAGRRPERQPAAARL